MKYWIARTFGAAVCTLSLVALGTAGAYAAPHPSDGGIDIDLGGVKVKVGGHDSSQGGTKSKSGSSSHTSSSSKDLVKVRVNTPGRVLPRVQVKANVGSGSNGPSVRVRSNVGSSSHTPSSSHASAAAKAAQQKVEARKAAAKRAEARKVAAKKAAAKRVAERKAVAARDDRTRSLVAAVASVRALPGVVPQTVVRADATVASVPVRACVEVNVDGCSRYVYSGTPTSPANGEYGGGGYKTVSPAVLPAVVATAAAKGEGAVGSLPTVVPPVLALADAKVLSVPVRACVEVNATGCARYVYSGPPAPNQGTENGGGGFAAVLPSVLAQAQAAVPLVGQADACVLVNTVGCTPAGGTGTGSGGAPGTGGLPGTGGVLPVVVGTVGADVPVVGQVDACVLVNAPGCQGGAGTGTTPGDGIIPPVVGTVGGELPGGGTVGVCVLVNTPGCDNPGGDPTAPGGDETGPTVPGTGGDPTDPGSSAPGHGAPGNGAPVAATTGPVAADIGAQGGGSGDRSLAHTGASAGMLGALAAGLGLVGASVVVLRRRRTRGE